MRQELINDIAKAVADELERREIAKTAQKTNDLIKEFANWVREQESEDAADDRDETEPFKTIWLKQYLCATPGCDILKTIDSEFCWSCLYDRTKYSSSNLWRNIIRERYF